MRDPLGQRCIGQVMCTRRTRGSGPSSLVIASGVAHTVIRKSAITIPGRKGRNENNNGSERTSPWRSGRTLTRMQCLPPSVPSACLNSTVSKIVKSGRKSRNK